MPVFLIDQMQGDLRLRGHPLPDEPDLIDRAWANMFVRDEEIVR
jgi:hypothetical protein